MPGSMAKSFLPFALVLVLSPAAAQYRGAAAVYLNQVDFSRYPLVDLYVTLATPAGEPLTLQESDAAAIQISQNGIRVRPSDIQSLQALKERGQAEIYIAMVFDNSESMRGRTDLLEGAARRFIGNLRTGDFVSLIDFGDGKQLANVAEYDRPVHGRVRLPFSNSKAILRKNLPMGSLTARTFMYDALILALSSLQRESVLGRKAVVLFSDGLENGSVASLADVRGVLSRTGIPVYAIDLNPEVNPTLQTLAQSSGGEYFHVKRPSDLTDLYQEVLNLLNGQYRITYVSPDKNVSANTYAMEVVTEGRLTGRASRLFTIDGQSIAYYNLAHRESQGSQSVSDYLDFLSGFPRSKHTDDVRIRLGRFWQQRGETSKALGVFNIILRNPQSAAYNQALLQKAEVLRNEKRYGAARQAYAEVLKTESDPTVRAKAMLDLAKAYTAEGNFSLALDTYSELTSAYEGSEIASEAFLQAATLNMEMGNLPAAEQNLEQLVQVYGESKTAVYGRLELARIAARTGRHREAEQLYAQVLQSHTDSEIKHDAVLGRSAALLAVGDAAQAESVLRMLIRETANEASAQEAKAMLVPVLLHEGKLAEARQIFADLPRDLQSRLQSEQRAVPVRSARGDGTALVNGAFLEGPSGDSARPALATIEWPDAVEKFAAVGPVYHLQPSVLPSAAAIPVHPGWVRSGTVVPGVSGIFRYEAGNWEEITRRYDSGERAFVFVCERPGVYALLARPPKIIRLYNIYFDLGKSAIRREDERNLFSIIDDLKAVPDARVEIGGHTDSTGTEEFNIELSSRRANVIKTFMMQNGIDEERLIARGYGSQYPLVPNTTPANLQKNRRTEFTLIRPIADPMGGRGGAKELYTVILRACRTAKEAYEDKKLFQGRGFEVMVVTNEERLSSKYELSLGIFESENDARRAIGAFRQEFPGIEPEIVVSRARR